MSLQAANKKVITDRSKQLRQIPDIQRFHPVNSKGIDILRHCSTMPWRFPRRSKPRIGLPPGYLMAKHVNGSISFHQSKRIFFGNGTLRNRILRPGIRVLIDVGELPRQLRQSTLRQKGSADTLLSHTAKVVPTPQTVEAPAIALKPVWYGRP